MPERLAERFARMVDRPWDDLLAILLWSDLSWQTASLLLFPGHSAFWPFSNPQQGYYAAAFTGALLITGILGRWQQRGRRWWLFVVMGWYLLEWATLLFVAEQARHPGAMAPLWFGLIAAMLYWRQGLHREVPP